MGFVTGYGMGAIALPFAELKAWSEMTARPLNPMEVSCLRQASEHYAAMVNASVRNRPSKG